MSTVQRVEQALAAGRDEAAVTEARALLAADPNNSGTVLRELGGAMARAYRALHAQSVYALRDALAGELGQGSMTMLLQPLHADLELTDTWYRRLEVVARERLSNDLMDRVKSNDMAGAEEIVATLLAGRIGATTAGEADPGQTQRARHIGVLLGGMVYEKNRAEAVIRAVSRNPLKFGIDFMAATDMEEEYVRAEAAAARRERPAASVARVELVQATVELGRALPQRMVIAEPTGEQLELFEQTLRALFRCALTSPRQSWFHEITLLLVEFSPKELSTAGALAGVEQRLYGSLGRTARMVAAQGLKDIGHDPVAWHAYFDFARRHLHDRIGHYAVEVMGLFANREAVTFVIEAMWDKKARSRTEAIFALGGIGDPEAQAALLTALDHDFKGRVIEGDARREAATIISSLGRSARATNNPEKRGQIAARVIRALPKDDTEFKVRTVLNFFVGKLEGMSPDLLEWAARVGTSALWSIDRPELARAGKTAELGFRQPLIDLLGRLAPFTYDTINQTALELAKTYCGAYLAMGEFYAKNPDPRALPVLNQLLTNTFLHDDSETKSQYVKEQVLDLSTDERQDLNHDRVIASIVHALNQIGGEEADAILSNVYGQIQAGRVARPGSETADILMQSYMRITKARTGSAFPTPGGGEAHSGDANLAADFSASATQITEEDLRHISDLNASYLLSSKRRAKKVAALASLAPRKVAAAVPAIVEHLADKDPMIAAAAQTAVVDMAAPPIQSAVLAQLHMELIQSLELGDTDTRLKISEALAKLGPTRSPLKEKLEAIKARPGIELSLRSMIDRLLHAGKGGAAGAAGAGHADAHAIAPGGALSDLDKKRQHMVARQAWIKGGKRGPEPEFPE